MLVPTPNTRVRSYLLAGEGLRSVLSVRQLAALRSGKAVTKAAEVSIDAGEEEGGTGDSEERARIGALLGVPPAHIEHGYVQRYAAGFAMHNLHLDHNPASMRPRRVASLIVYLDDQVSEPFPLRLFSQRSFLPPL